MKSKEAKTLVRNEIKKIRENLSIDEKNLLEERIVEKFFNLEIVKNSDTFMSYMDFKNEVPTKKINETLIKLGKTLALPKIIKEDMVAILNNNQFEIGKYGISEPLGDRFSKNIDVVIVPGVTFNRKGDRIGFGKGYYDRFLANENYRNTFKIALAYDFQINDNFVGEDFDIKVDLIVSDKEIIEIRKF